jgi:hypothetical protein
MWKSLLLKSADRIRRSLDFHQRMVLIISEMPSETRASAGCFAPRRRSQRPRARMPHLLASRPPSRCAVPFASPPPATAAGYHVERLPGRVAQGLTGAGRGNDVCGSLHLRRWTSGEAREDAGLGAGDPHASCALGVHLAHRAWPCPAIREGAVATWIPGLDGACAGAPAQLLRGPAAQACDRAPGRSQAVPGGRWAPEYRPAQWSQRRRRRGHLYCCGVLPKSTFMRPCTAFSPQIRCIRAWGSATVGVWGSSRA